MTDIWPHRGPSGPVTSHPMAPCLALLKSFDPDHATPQQAIAAGHGVVSTVLGQEAMADLSDGQLAALIDLVIDTGADAFATSNIAIWVKDGNLTWPPKAMGFAGPRGMARGQVWNIGNST